MCGDFKVTINPHLLLDKHPLPKPQELFDKLGGGIEFSKIDLTNAYQQILVDEDSEKFLVISTHLGLFKYKRLPFGINSAPSIFQKFMEKLLAGIEGVVVFIDDICVTGRNSAEHLSRLRKVLEIFESSGLKISSEKCIFSKNLLNI